MIVQTLIDRGAKPESKDVAGRTAETIAREAGHFEIAELIRTKQHNQAMGRDDI